VPDSQNISRYSRGFAAQKFYFVVWQMREAHLPHNKIKQAGAVGASTRREGEASEKQTRSK